MASLIVSWVWIFVILTGASNGYPLKKALDPRRASNVNSPSGSNWEVPVPASGLVQAESGSTAASNPMHHSAPHEQHRYSHSSAKMRPAPVVYSSNEFAAPVYLGYDGRFPTSSTKLSFQQHPKDDRVEPSGALADGTTSSTPPSSKPKLYGLSNESPQSFPFFQPGDSSYRAKLYDHGSYESETEERPPSQYTPFQAMPRFPIGSMLRFGPFVDGFWFGHPYIDHVLLTRKYPLGTYRLSSNIFEHGKNHRHDTIIVHDPTAPSTLQSETFPKGIKQPSQSVQSGNAGYELVGDVTG